MALEPTNLEDWIRSDIYHNRYLIPRDESLTTTLKLSEENGLPLYAVSEAQGKFLNLLAKSIQAHRIVEVGTLGGYVSNNSLLEKHPLFLCRIFCVT